MVSPSKLQHHEHQPSRENKSDKRSHVRIQRGPKPLEKKSFYLDIKNHATAAKIEAKIKDLGGVIELFLVRSVTLVASDRVNKSGYVNWEKRKWGCATGGSGGFPSLRSTEAPTPTPTPPTPFFSSECPLSNSANQRAQSAQRSKSRVDAMLERALVQPQQCSVDPLDNAQTWGIPIWAIDKLQTWLDKIYASLKNTNDSKQIKNPGQSNKDSRVRHLKGSFIKFESFHRNTRPVFLELPAWPTLNLNGEPGSCPFNAKRREKVESKLTKEVKENREDIRPTDKEENKEMTRRPRTTTARTRRTEQLASGYCEICRIGYRDLSKHVQTDQHLNFVRNDDNFLSLDTLISAGANVEAFLKLNRTKDIEKDCNLFPNGDRDLRDVVLPETKVSKGGKGLNGFGVEEIKMVQCNGARRSLNLNLSSPHNLRARAKHESGHLLRSKGSPWHEIEKVDKFYDKFEGFTIKKRAKGTIWIEEEDPEDGFIQDTDLKETKVDEYKIKSYGKESEEKDDKIVCNKRCNGEDQELVLRTEQKGSSYKDLDPVKQVNGDLKGRRSDPVNENDRAQVNCLARTGASSESSKCLNGNREANSEQGRKRPEECERVNLEVVCNGQGVKNEEKLDEKLERNDAKEERPKCGRSGRRGGRSAAKGRHRLSVEERLIEDNRAYYKVEVLGSKLRSSVVPGGNSQCLASREAENEEKKEAPSSEKPVVVRFKRVRKSELSLLSDEAESFMFGEPKRDDSSETSDDEQSSILPRDTESECNDNATSGFLSSSLNSSSSVKSDAQDEDSQDSLNLGRARKRRRTQAEALIKDNTDYYKFETPGSRLRYQAPLTGIKDTAGENNVPNGNVDEERQREEVDVVEKIYPSKPSAEVEKMQFSFEAVPTSEPWYQTYQRQDKGAEFWHYFSEGDSRKPFLLPYEIENFHEILIRSLNRVEVKKRSRGRGMGCLVGRSPRKSPRCHASTLAIMSTIIRKKEQQQQQQQQSLYTIDECNTVSERSQTPRPDSAKLDVDEELKEMVRNIDEMLNEKGNIDMDDSFEPDITQVGFNFYDTSIERGPPENLLELLDNCHEIGNCLENSSCASSECGEGNVESPLKRRKKRKNRTGWPGIKMKKKLQSKPLPETEANNSPSGPFEPGQETTACETGTLRNEEDESKDGPCGKSKGKAELHETSLRPNLDEPPSETQCTEPERNFSVLGKDYTEFRKAETPEVDEVSENDPGNLENHENMFRKDVHGLPMSDRRFISKKRQKDNAGSEACEPEMIEKLDDVVIRRKDPSSEPRIVSRRHHRNANELPKKRQQKSRGSENGESGLECHGNSIVYRRGKVSRKRIYSRRPRPRKSNPCTTAEPVVVFDDENCKKDNTYLGIKCKKEDKAKRQRTEAQLPLETTGQDHPKEIECQRMVSSPSSETLLQSEARRSSIDFQPVVRMMKIDDRVEVVDHSILSVTVASNRRLRSSSSPRSDRGQQPPKKRLKTSRGQFGSWLKTS